MVVRVSCLSREKMERWKLFPRPLLMHDFTITSSFSSAFSCFYTLDGFTAISIHTTTLVEVLVLYVEDDLTLFSSSSLCISLYLFKILNVARDVIRLSLIRHSSSFAHWPRLVQKQWRKQYYLCSVFLSPHHQHFVLQLECCEQNLLLVLGTPIYDDDVLM